PGSKILISGYDSTQLATSDNREFKSDIFSYTFSSPLTCKRSTLGGGCYLIPDEIGEPDDIDETKAKSVADVFYSSYEYASTYAESYTCKVGFVTPYLGASYNYHSELYESRS